MRRHKPYVLVGLVLAAVMLVGFDALRRQVEALENRVSKVEQRARKNSGDIVLLKGRIERVEKGSNRQSPKPGEIHVGGGFYLSNVRLPGHTAVVPWSGIVGKISNRSGKDYEKAVFIVSFYYNPSDRMKPGSLLRPAKPTPQLVKKVFVTIHDIQDGEVKEFRATCGGVFDTYKVQFNEGL